MRLQSYVRRSDLKPGVGAMLLGTYPDFPVQPRELHGADCTVLLVNASSTTTVNYIPRLKDDWRSGMATTVQGEAARRIHEAFPEYMQSNANNDLNASIMKHGSDPATWPADAQDRRAEGNRGWAYIASIRQYSDALSGQLELIDPTADALWPTKIAPIYIPVVT